MKASTAPAHDEIPVLGVRLFEQFTAMTPLLTREQQIAFKDILVSKKDGGASVFFEWSRRMPFDLQRETTADRTPFELVGLCVLLAWGCEQPWYKSIDMDVVRLRWSLRLEHMAKINAIEANTACVGMLHALMDHFPKAIAAHVLDFWLDPARPVWALDRAQAASMLVSRQAGAWESLAQMASSSSGKGKTNAPIKRWSNNLQKCLAIMPTNVQRLYIEHFIDSSMADVDKVRGARCAHAKAWVGIADKLLPLMPNNEWTRYDLLPVCQPSPAFSPEEAGRLNRELATLYAPALTQTISTLASDMDWANPTFIRSLVDQTYRNHKGLPVPQQEAFELPSDLGDGLFA